jgi:ParB family chromosome partitioning protein
MAASIQQVGIIQSLLVVPLTGNETQESSRPEAVDGENQQQYRIIVGHRRHAAALLLELASVPCLVAEAGDEASHLFTMLTENLHRQDLSIQEEADAYAQLALLDISEDEIATRMAFPVERVSAGLALTRLPKRVRDEAAELIQQHGIDLEQVLALEEFADDDEALQRLMLHADGKQMWSFKHILGQERDKRAKREAVEALTAELVLARVRVVPSPRDWHTGPYVKAEDLLDRDGNPLDPDVVKARPGFKAWINQNGDPAAVIFCTHPEDWGYTHRDSVDQDTDDSDADDEASASSTGAEVDRAERAVEARRLRDERLGVAEAERAERQRQREHRMNAFTTATQVRYDFLVSHFASAKAAKKALPEALRHVLKHETLSWDDQDEGAEQLMRRLAGIPSTVDSVRDAVLTAGLDRLTRLAVASWLCEEEDNLSRMVQHWTHNALEAVAYLDLLVASGYQLADIEQTLHEEARPTEKTTSDDGSADSGGTTETEPTGAADDIVEDQVADAVPETVDGSSGDELVGTGGETSTDDNPDTNTDHDGQGRESQDGRDDEGVSNQYPEPLSA